MPRGAGHPRPVDLWLCGHHFRAAFDELKLAGAVIEELGSAADDPRSARIRGGRPAAAALVPAPRTVA
ncbi:MAG TPA: hypothetical protein VK817_00320 [Trebonia sp.]|nr:hypothetical protein [Trebonia sp.]